MQGFRTERLTIEDWTPHLGDPERRSSLEARLDGILTPAVLTHLPEPLQITGSYGIPDWIDDRAAESQVFLIGERPSEMLIGLLILAQFGASPRDIHIGYLFAEEAWGKGYATEMLRGFVAKAPRPAHLLAGVEAGNPASARVLEKVGFTRAPRADLFAMTLN